MFCSCHTHYVPAVHLRGRGPPPDCRCHRGGGELCNTEAQPQGGRRAERWEDRRPPAPAVRSAGPTLTPALGPASLLCPWDSSGRILERVAIPFSRGSSRPRDRIRVSCVGRWIPHHCTTRETGPRRTKATEHKDTQVLLRDFSSSGLDRSQTSITGDWLSK